eukprot:UN12102
MQLNLPEFQSVDIVILNTLNNLLASLLFCLIIFRNSQ